MRSISLHAAESGVGKHTARERSGVNPLKVNGIYDKLEAGKPRSSLLSEDQKGALRTFFKVPPPLDPGSFSALSKEERKKTSAAQSLPRWAVTAVLRDPGNLPRILKREITKDNFVTKVPPMQTAKPGSLPPGGCATEWRALREKFKGVGLFVTPRTTREKNLKKGFDALVAKYTPANPSLPKPRVRGDKDVSRTPAQKVPVKTDSSGDLLTNSLASLIELGKVFKQVREALS